MNYHPVASYDLTGSVKSDTGIAAHKTLCVQEIVSGECILRTTSLLFRHPF